MTIDDPVDESALATDRDDLRVIRVFRFRPVRAGFDGTLRDVMIPDLVRLPGIEAVYVGRQGPSDVGERLLTTVWATRADMAAGVGTSFDRPVFHPEYIDDTEEKRLDIAPIWFAVDPVSDEAPNVIRVVFGRANAGRLAEYVEEARLGTLADIDAGRGPHSLYLGRLDDDQFVTVSTWAEWSTIGKATGGTILAPTATRHAELLLEWHVAHYEAVPSAPVPSRSVPAAKVAATEP